MVPEPSVEYQPEAVLLYDRDCGFCRWSVAKLLALDRRRRLRVVALQDPEAEQLLAGLSPEERMRSSHVVLPDGSVHSGGASLAPLARLVPAALPAGAIARLAPGLVERAYQLVAANRSSVSRLVPAAAKRRADRDLERRTSAG